MAAQKGVSFRPSDFSAGGFMDDVDARILSARVKPFDYNGTVTPPVTALAVMYQDVNDDERTSEQFYSIGPSDKFTPSADGLRAIPTSESSKVAQTSNAAMFFAALMTAGFPEDKMGDDVSILDGAVVHLNQTAAPKRKFKDGESKGKENATILLPTKIVTLPWDVPAAEKKANAKKAAAASTTAAASKPAGAPAATAPVEGNTDASDAAVAFVLEQLANNDGTVNKNTLPTAAFKLQGNPQRNAITQLVAKEAWLSDPARPWQYADGVLSMG